MSEEADKEMEAPRSPSAEGQSAQSLVLDLLIRGLETAKKQVDKQQEGIASDACVLIYLSAQ
jgi:hypothetical protein